MERKEHWSKSEVHELLKMKVNPDTLIKAEERGDIPEAERFKRKGKRGIEVRKWRRDQLPAIGAKYGFLKQPKEQHVICVFTPKGGVLKTTLSFNFARLLALNGIKTLVIGLDAQCSMTDLLLTANTVENLDDYKPIPGLFHILRDKHPIEKAIIPTDLPTLDVLPETVELIALENHIRERNKREQVLIDEILPHLKDYQAIIFDTPPSWNFLIMNALVASRHVISPVGCDLGSLQALTTNLNTLTEFKSRMKLDWDTFLLVPTLLQRTKLSSQIQSAYVSKYKEQVTAGTIRRAVKGEESLAFQESVIENNSKSEIAQDYYQIIQELWQTFLDAEKRRGN